LLYDSASAPPATTPLPPPLPKQLPPVHRPRSFLAAAG
jgi:hypothetical protein